MSKIIFATAVPDTHEDLKLGSKVFVAGARQLPDGSLGVAASQVLARRGLLSIR